LEESAKLSSTNNRTTQASGNHDFVRMREDEAWKKLLKHDRQIWKWVFKLEGLEGGEGDIINFFQRLWSTSLYLK
jgi:hypothetical protein